MFKTKPKHVTHNKTFECQKNAQTISSNSKKFEKGTKGSPSIEKPDFKQIISTITKQSRTNGRTIKSGKMFVLHKMNFL